MKKYLFFLTSITFLTTASLYTLACGNSFLEITNDEIYDNFGKTTKIDNIAFNYMYALPKEEKPKYEIAYFYEWDWILNNRQKIIGYNSAKSFGYWREYWKIVIQKTKNKGIFVSKYTKSYEFIK